MWVVRTRLLCLARQIMMQGKDSILRRFALHPPKLDGGIELSLTQRDNRRWIVRLRHGDVRVELQAAGLAVPYPSGLARLRASDPDIELVLVERLPPGLRAAAEQAGIGCLDLAGRGHVVAPGLVYSASGGREPRPARRVRTSPFASKASRVARSLLSAPDRAWRLSELAELTELNPGNVHRALAGLVELGTLERDMDRYVVADPGSLLEAWAAQAQPPRDVCRFAVDGELHAAAGDLLERLEGQAVVSGEAAAEVLAPHLPATSAIVHCFDADRFAALAREASAHSAPRAGDRRAAITVDLADAGCANHSTSKDGVVVACAQQVYVDLFRSRGRGREAGEHLRRTVLGF